MNETLYLLDGSSFIHRAYHAMRGMTTPAGFPTNAIFGFTALLNRLLKEQNPTHLVAVFDGRKKNSYRRTIYPEYKANRPPTPEDLSLQIPRVMQIVDAYNIPMIKCERVEADDIIASLVSRFESRTKNIVILSSDKDLMQLVTDRVQMWDTMRDKHYDPAAVQEKFGVPPHKIGDLLALMGDSSDNIPGVPGIGRKTAATLLNEFEDLDDILARTGEVRSKRARVRLAEHRDLALLSRRLVELQRDIEIPDSLDRLKIGTPNHQKLRNLFQELNFRRFLEDVRVEKSALTIDRSGYRTVLTIDQLITLLGRIDRAGTLALAPLLATANPTEAEIVGFGICWSASEAVYVPTGHRNYLGAPAQLDTREVLECIRPLLLSDSLKLECHDFKQLLRIFARYGIEPATPHCDTRLASYLLDPERKHDLPLLAKEVLDHQSLPRPGGSGKGSTSLSSIDVERTTPFGAERAQLIHLLSRQLLPQLEERKLAPLLRDVEAPLSRVLARMEDRGILVDVPLLEGLSRRFGDESRALEQEIYSAAGRSFNINSPKQLAEILFNELGLPAKKKTRSGYSTDQSVLEELAAIDPLPGKVLEYRRITKLKSTYTDALPQMVQAGDGRIHTSFNQTVTATGRLSSTSPNLQNIPIRTSAGMQIRGAFIAREGTRLLSADYSQIELRVLAHLSGDPALCDAFAAGRDIHAQTAAEIFDTELERVDSNQRRIAKAINFGIIYGMGPNRLARDVGITRESAKSYIERYFERYPVVRQTLDRIVDDARRDGFVTTLLHRRRYLNDIRSQNRMARAAAERAALNTPVQGSAADLIKLAMLNVSKRIESDKLPVEMLLQVHDELVFEVEWSALDRVEPIIVREMERIMELKVPLKVDLKRGRCWMFSDNGGKETHGT